MERTKIYFLSDLHLGARYISDRRSHENRVVAFLESIADDAREIYLLGDILDYWFEYRTVVPRGYVRFFGVLARLVDKGVKITWFVGNHDIWLFDYLRDEIGIEVVDPKDGGEFRTIDGVSFYLGHGDGIGYRKPSFRLIRSVFRNRLCQKLFSAIHPRWTIPFAHRWSSSSRGSYAGMSGLESLTISAREIASAHKDLRYIIMGHIHTATNIPLEGTDCRLLVLGEWIAQNTYAVWDGSRLSLQSYKDIIR